MNFQVFFWFSVNWSLRLCLVKTRLTFDEIEKTNSNIPRFGSIWTLQDFTRIWNPLIGSEICWTIQKMALWTSRIWKIQEQRGNKQSRLKQNIYKNQENISWKMFTEYLFFFLWYNLFLFITVLTLLITSPEDERV